MNESNLKDVHFEICHGGIAIFQVLASLEPCFYVRSSVRMALRGLTEKQFNREIVILILPPQTLLSMAEKGFKSCSQPH